MFVRDFNGSAQREVTPENWEAAGASASELPGERSQELADIARNHHDALVRFLTVRMGSKEEAKDIAQEAYAKLLALDRPGPISFLAGYLWRIATNLAIDRGRQRGVRERFAGLVSRDDEGLSPSAEQVVEARQRLATVEQAIGELPPKCLEAFRLRVLNGLPFDQVGREMHMSDRMAKNYVARALEHLQSRLERADQPRSRW